MERMEVQTSSQFNTNGRDATRVGVNSGGDQDAVWSFFFSFRQRTILSAVDLQLACLTWQGLHLPPCLPVHDNGRYEGPGYFPFPQQPQRTMWKWIPNQIMMPSDPNTIMYSILLLSTQGQIGSSGQTGTSRECRIGTIWATMEAQPLHNLFSYEVTQMPSVWKSSTLTKQIDHMMGGWRTRAKEKRKEH